MLRPVHLRTLLDRFARAIITVGGLATIVSILGIFFFLFREVTPLFTAPSAKLTQRLSVPALLVDEGPAQVAVDEHRVAVERRAGLEKAYEIGVVANQRYAADRHQR